MKVKLISGGLKRDLSAQSEVPESSGSGFLVPQPESWCCAGECGDSHKLQVNFNKPLTLETLPSGHRDLL